MEKLAGKSVPSNVRGVPGSVMEGERWKRSREKGLVCGRDQGGGGGHPRR